MKIKKKNRQSSQRFSQFLLFPFIFRFDKFNYGNEKFRV